MPEVVEHALNPVAVGCARRANRPDDLAAEIVRRLLVGVEQQNPLARRVIERDLFLANVICERLIENLRTEALGDFDGAVGRI
jgi:hypothetical protein